MKLAEQLDHLDDLLLGPITTQFPTPLTESEKAGLNAYLVLAHAVLEEHLEGAFQTHYQRLCGWGDSSLVPREMAALAFAIGSSLPDNLRAPYKTRTLAGMLKAAERHVTAQIRENHGVRVQNLRKLAELVGLEWPKFEDELNSSMLDLETLAAHRGEAGHLSPYSDKAVRITQTTYPDDVRTWVHQARDAAIAIGAHIRRTVDDQQPLSLIHDWDGN